MPWRYIRMVGVDALPRLIRCSSADATTVLTDPDDLNACVDQEMEKLRDEGQLVVRPSRKCYICRDDAMRILINKLIGLGQSNPEIMEVLKPINDARPKKDRVNYRGLWRHTREHYDPEHPAREVYRNIQRRILADEGRDFETAVGDTVNALIYHYTMMVKGYSTLINEKTEVTVSEGASAAKQYYAMTRQDAGLQEMAELMAKQNRIIAAFREEVPERYHAAIIARLEGKEAPVEAEEVKELNKGDEPYDPLFLHDDHDEDEDDV